MVCPGDRLNDRPAVKHSADSGAPLPEGASGRDKGILRQGGMGRREGREGVQGNWKERTGRENKAGFEGEEEETRKGGNEGGDALPT